jgi:hypothetical protein
MHAKSEEVELCSFCAGTPRGLANKGHRIASISMCITSSIANKMVKHFERYFDFFLTFEGCWRRQQLLQGQTPLRKLLHSFSIAALIFLQRCNHHLAMKRRRQNRYLFFSCRGDVSRSIFSNLKQRHDAPPVPQVPLIEARPSHAEKPVQRTVSVEAPTNPKDAIKESEEIKSADDEGSTVDDDPDEQATPANTAKVGS